MVNVCLLYRFNFWAVEKKTEKWKLIIIKQKKLNRNHSYNWLNYFKSCNRELKFISE